MLLLRVRIMMMPVASTKPLTAAMNAARIGRHARQRAWHG
jgi:hypothetical protein